jgi:hypothetical protein
VALHLNDYDRAWELLTENLALFWELGDQAGIAYSLAGLGSVTGALGQSERSARLFGAAEFVREQIGLSLPPSDRALHDRYLAIARAGTDTGAWAAAWAEGRQLPLRQVVAEVQAHAGLEASASV